MDIVTIANRLPVRMGEDGWELSPGGLVTALRPVMAAHSGAWVGWDGGTRGIPATLPDLSVRLLPAGLSASQVRQYYHGFANATLWPLLHDAAEFARLATDPETGRDIEAVREQFAGRTLLLGVDRLDYTKGITERLLAVEMLLERRADLRESLAFLQVAVPSRDDVPEYRNLRATVERHIGRINGRFTEPGSDVPIHYLYRGLPPQQLAAYYAAAEALLVTPLIDGMNLVAKEYVTVQYARRGSGSLVLSEFTGAAAELREAVPCNPFDVEGLSYRIEHALGLQASARRAALATV